MKRIAAIPLALLIFFAHGWFALPALASGAEAGLLPIKEKRPPVRMFVRLEVFFD